MIGHLLGVFRRSKEDNVAFEGDKIKMFLQILLTEGDSQVHRLSWRNRDATVSPYICRLARVVVGDKQQPDMASYVMLRIAKEFQTTFPEASKILMKDRYMDDLIHPCKTLKDPFKWQL